MAKKNQKYADQQEMPTDFWNAPFNPISGHFINTAKKYSKYERNTKVPNKK